MSRRPVLIALAVLALVAAGCGGGAKKGSTPTTVAPSTAVVTTTGPTSTTASSLPTTTSTTTTAPPPADFTAVAGSYIAGTADGGSLYIRPDGASRFLGPDGVACPTCGTATSPIASLDFALRTLTRGASDSSTATGVVTATSDAPWASLLAGSPTVGTPVTLHITAPRQLTASFLGPNDILQFASTVAPYANTSPCTVAAVTSALNPTHSLGPAFTVRSVTCAIDEQWAAGTAIKDPGATTYDFVLEAAFTVWKAVDRTTVCTGHDVPPDFYATACG